MIIKRILITSFILGSIFLFSCEKSVIEFADQGTIKKDTAASAPISFQATILPIFNANCTSCHGGSIAPNLTNANAFTSINVTKYIDKTTPTNSLIYTKLITIGNSHDGRATQAQANSILTWIKEGASNN